VSDGGGEEAGFCWEALVARVLHPVDVQIIEALLWIGQPLSAGDLTQLFDDDRWALFGRHLRRLAKLDAVELGETPTLGNVADVSYRLAVKRPGDDR
jgi:hypothetical protein